MKTISIYGHKVKPGQSIQIDIPVARLPSHTLIDLPAFVYRAAKPGPTLLLSAGIHGDEINGIEIIRRLISRDLIFPDAGMVIALPLVNIYGFLHHSRQLPDGKDLNRCFPGSQKGSLARQIAYMLMNEIIPHIDYGVDFHTGGARISNYPQIRATLDDDKNKELGMAFGAPLLINSNLIDKSFRKAAYKAGKTILVYEGGESLRIDEFAVDKAIEGVLRLMHHLNMKEVGPGPAETSLIKSSSWVRARISGIFHSKVGYGEKVKKNQLVAKINDPYGSSLHNVKSPMDGVVIGVNNMPVINAGNALLHIGSTEYITGADGEE
ncbi:succinylglutamate desuccinylase/aspartoacylase family protein [Roseivirga sp. BDSF3-8]|uniref:succinylglutamate desuccinylase/aspartoacylase family protein n=1 Tax=Roseivirga sp. BDSF3-8 TaxID=3241598 RepID=UPI00353219E6